MVTPRVPSLSKVRAAWKEAEVEQTFWQEHYREFLEKYPDQFVAVYEGTVVATSVDLQLLTHILRDRGLDFRKVRVSFITSDPRRVML